VCRVMLPLRSTEEASLLWISRERATRDASRPRKWSAGSVHTKRSKIVVRGVLPLETD